MVKSKVFIFEKQFDEFPKEDDLHLIEEELPPIKDGGGNDAEVFRNRKSFFSINVQAVCNSELKALDVVARWLGSAHDSTIFNNSHIRMRYENGEFPNSYLLEFLAEAVYLSVDPYMRSWAPRLPLGVTLIGTQIAKIIESKNSKYPIGRYVAGTFGWRSHTVSNGKSIFPGSPDAYLLPLEGEFSPSYFLGIFGMPGCTAYFGLLDIIKPKRGQTIVVSGAAGAVGSVVGQIAKIKGCTVIGIAGSDEKGRWLTDELGFDYFINYKTADLNKALSEYAPNGIDGYFDNVGGETTSNILNHMKTFGRIAICGSISGYNEREPKATPFQRATVFKQLRIEGLSVFRWRDSWQNAIQEMIKWYNEGKLKYKETRTKGFENMFTAFINMLHGGNTGKAIVEV